MHDSQKTWLNDKNSTIKKHAYKECKKQVQTACRRMKESWWHSKAAELQEAANKKDPKAFCEGLKKLFGPLENGSSPVLSSDGWTFY